MDMLFTAHDMNDVNSLSRHPVKDSARINNELAVGQAAEFIGARAHARKPPQAFDSG